MPKLSRVAVISVFASFLVACSAAPEQRTAEGMSEASAALIAGAATPAEVEALQRAWISARFPDAKPDFASSRYVFLSTAVVQKVPALLSDGRNVVFYFNITPSILK